MPVLIKFDNTTQCPQQAQIIPDATKFNDGVMTKAQAAQLAGLVPPTPGAIPATFSNAALALNIFVDSINGNDSNDGLSPATALKSIFAIYTRIPTTQVTPTFVVVHLASNGNLQAFYPISSAPDSFGSGALFYSGGAPFWTTLAVQGPPMVPATLATGPTTAALDLVPATEINLNNASGVATPLRTQLNFTAAAPGWTPHDMAGRFFVRVTRAGVQQYFELPISDNTANTIFVDTTSATPSGATFPGGANGAIVGDLLSTDTVEIVQPGAVITDPVGVPPGTGGVHLLGKNTINPYIGALFSGGGPPNFLRCGFLTNIIQSNLPIAFDRCNFTGSPFAGAPNHELAPFDAMMLVNCAFLNSLINYIGPTSQPGPYLSFLDTSINNTNPSVTFAAFNSSMTIGYGGPSPQPYFGPGYPASAMFALPVSLWSSNPLPQSGNNGGVVTIGSAGSTVTFKGSLVGNTVIDHSPGLRARSNGTIVVNPALLALIGDPVYGDLQVETGAPIYLGAGAGQYMEAVGYNGNFTRRLEGTATHPTGDNSSINQFLGFA